MARREVRSGRRVVLEGALAASLLMSTGAVAEEAFVFVGPLLPGSGGRTSDGVPPSAPASWDDEAAWVMPVEGRSLSPRRYARWRTGDAPPAQVAVVRLRPEVVFPTLDPLHGRDRPTPPLRLHVPLPHGDQVGGPGDIHAQRTSYHFHPDGSRTWVGRDLNGGGDVILTLAGDTVFGILEGRYGTFQLEDSGIGQAFLLVEAAEGEPVEVDPEHPANQTPEPNWDVDPQPVVWPGDGATFIDLLVTWTPQARQERADEDPDHAWNMQAYAWSLVHQTNLVFRRSGIHGHRLRIVGFREMHAVDTVDGMDSLTDLLGYAYDGDFSEDCGDHGWLDNHLVVRDPFWLWWNVGLKPVAAGLLSSLDTSETGDTGAAAADLAPRIHEVVGDVGADLVVAFTANGRELSCATSGNEVLGAARGGEVSRYTSGGPVPQDAAKSEDEGSLVWLAVDGKTSRQWTMAHEIGHALGILHPGQYDLQGLSLANEDGRSSFAHADGSSDPTHADPLRGFEEGDVAYATITTNRGEPRLPVYSNKALVWVPGEEKAPSTNDHIRTDGLVTRLDDLDPSMVASGDVWPLGNEARDVSTEAGPVRVQARDAVGYLTSAPWVHDALGLVMWDAPLDIVADYRAPAAVPAIGLAHWELPAVGDQPHQQSSYTVRFRVTEWAYRQVCDGAGIARSSLDDEPYYVVDAGSAPGLADLGQQVVLGADFMYDLCDAEPPQTGWMPPGPTDPPVWDADWREVAVELSMGDHVVGAPLHLTLWTRLGPDHWAPQLRSYRDVDVLVDCASEASLLTVPTYEVEGLTQVQAAVPTGSGVVQQLGYGPVERDYALSTCPVDGPCSVVTTGGEATGIVCDMRLLGGDEATAVGLSPVLTDGSDHYDFVLFGHDEAGHDFCCLYADAAETIRSVRFVGTPGDDALGFSHPDLPSLAALSPTHELELVLEGRGGDDLLEGSDAAGAGMTEWLIGGPGDDDLRGRGGDDHLAGGAGDDVLRGGDGDDVLMDNGGSDGFGELWGNGGDDVMCAEAAPAWFFDDAAAGASEVYVSHDATVAGDWLGMWMFSGPGTTCGHGGFGFEWTGVCDTLVDQAPAACSVDTWRVHGVED